MEKGSGGLVITVSLETLKIVRALPALDILIWRDFPA